MLKIFLLISGCKLITEFETLLQSGQLETIIKKLEQGELKANDDHAHIFENHKAQLNRMMSELSLRVASAGKPQIPSTPVIRWGQSQANLFMQVKLSHRFDAPACIQIESYNAKLENSVLIFSAVCHQAQKLIRFAFEIELFEDAKKVEVKQESIGTFVITVEKSVEKIWPDLFRNYEQRSLFKTKVWVELEKEHKNDMEEFLKLMEIYLDNKQNGNQEKIKKKNSRSKMGISAFFSTIVIFLLLT